MFFGKTILVMGLLLTLATPTFAMEDPTKPYALQELATEMPELASRVLEYLPFRDLARVSFTSKTLNRIANDDFLWRQFYQDWFGLDGEENQRPRAGKNFLEREFLNTFEHG